MKKLLLAGTGMALVLTACAGTPVPVPKSPDQALYDAGATYAAALTVVVAYGSLPLCPGNTWALTCHNGPFLVMARTASNAAGDGLYAARPLAAVYAALEAPAASDRAKIQAVIAAVTNEVAALQTLASAIATGGGGV